MRGRPEQRECEHCGNLRICTRNFVTDAIECRDCAKQAPDDAVHVAASVCDGCGAAPDELSQAPLSTPGVVDGGVYRSAWLCDRCMRVAEHGAAADAAEHAAPTVYREGASWWVAAPGDRRHAGPFTSMRDAETHVRCCCAVAARHR